MTTPPAPMDIDLPGIHDAADTASQRGQTRYLRLNGTRLIALLVAAVAGAWPFGAAGSDASDFILLGGFAIAAIAEVALITLQPERDWYAGRAVAESSKTLAWRFAAQGEPFGPSLTTSEAEALLRTRLTEVLQRGRDRIDVPPGQTVVTGTMRSLREKLIEDRKASYLKHRTREQQGWYNRNARMNGKRATGLRFALLTGEIVAVVVAAVSLGRDVPIDFAGIVAALVASGAAWLGIKQFSQITSAYRIAAGELGLQASLLERVSDTDWPQAVADAEEAISREHTMWLASRGEEPVR